MRSRSGFTLLELLVALLLLDLGILCLLATSAVAARELRHARLRDQAAQLAAQRVERLMAGACDSAQSGVAIHPGGLHEYWSVEPPRGGRRTVRDSIGIGAGSAPFPPVVVEGAIRC